MKVFKNKIEQSSKMSRAHLWKKDLKRRLTKSEKILYEELVKLKCKPKIQRLFFNPWSFYILDFYFAGKKVCIELDGESHKNQSIYDKKRDDFLFVYRGVLTIRILNETVLNNPVKIAKKIKQLIDEIPYYKVGKLRKYADVNRKKTISKFFADWGFNLDEASVHRKSVQAQS